MLRLWRYALSMLKTIPKNYNVAERAEKVLEVQKRAPPRHPGTEVKFQVLIKDNPGIKEEVEKKDFGLLDRLKIVKVTSKSAEEDFSGSKRALPQDRNIASIPRYGYYEPKIIPTGKCTFAQAMEFIGNHQNDPVTHSVESIAKTYSMETSDVENIITYFRAFELYVSRDSKNVDKNVLDNLGIGKVVRPLFHPKFSHLEEEKPAITKPTTKN